jgi:hypothetical protein
VRIREVDRGRIEQATMALGARLPARIISKASTLTGLLEMGRWMREQSYYPLPRLRSRNAIFDLIASEVGDAQALYLEFGVYQGESIRYWSKLLKNSESMLHGFDSFEGLPERWGDAPKGKFSTSGRVPEVHDTRVKFFKGWFEHTLPLYRVPAHDVLIINMDADLYASTKFVLDTLSGSIAIGDWLYFDEFSIPRHEFRAFREFVEQTNMRFQANAHSNYFTKIAFRRVK